MLEHEKLGDMQHYEDFKMDCNTNDTDQQYDFSSLEFYMSHEIGIVHSLKKIIGGEI